MDFIQQLRVFVTVADHGSFARAAEVLGLARPSVTHAINGLEAELGARLLQRTTRRTGLTAEGESFYGEANEVLSAVSQARSRFCGARAYPKGRLRIDMPISLAKHLILPRLDDFMRAYPEVDVSLGVSSQLTDLLAEGVDCVLRVGDIADSSMVTRVVGQLSMVACASPAYLDAHGTPSSIVDLEKHRAALFVSGRARRVLDWHFVVKGETKTVRMRPSLLVNDTEALIACALNGLGLVQTLGILVRDEFASGRLRQVLPQLDSGRRPVSVIYPARKHLSPQVRAFIDWAANIFSVADGPWVSGQ